MSASSKTFPAAVASHHPIQCKELLLTLFIGRAVKRAHEVLRLPSGNLIAKHIEDDGLSRIERLELSPIIEDQLLAVAFGRAGYDAVPDLKSDLTCYFRTGISTFSIEAQRQVVLSGLLEEGLPIGHAAEIVRSLIVKDALFAGKTSSDVFRSHADLYASLWCDPRLGAPTDVRRIMLAMANCFYDLVSNGGSERGKIAHT